MTNNILEGLVSKLGFGFMRLPKNGDEFDRAQINAMVDAFIDSGGTYFDTAWIYEGSEEALRDSLVKRYPRETFQIATKLNLRFLQSADQMESQFKTSISRLAVDYVDFYMLHGIDAPLSVERGEGWGAWDYVKDLKAKGLVRHWGFSFHGPPQDLEEILAKHPDAEFVQLQINYLDWKNPKVQAEALYEIARKHNIPIIVMEPLKGGLLTGDNSPIEDLLLGVDPTASLASWAFRFVAQLEGVFMTLSGMSSLEQLTENVTIFKNLKPLSDDELVTLTRAAEIIEAIPRIACTRCDYCKDCPMKIMIPGMINTYNDYMVYNTKNNVEHMYRLLSRLGANASACTECRACEDVCPQKLDITGTLAKLATLFD